MSEKKRILFVDDEENLLAAIQRVLRGHRDEWEMYFVSSATAALDLLKQQPMDVIVTDMKMPGVQGHELLEQVVQINPSVARIVLSGHVDSAAAARTVELAHQFLPKPCEPEALRNAIQRTLKTQQRITDSRAREVLGNVGKIPALPKVYQELNEALRLEQVDGKTIAAIIARDMSMSAKLLQMVNSSFFGLGRRVSSVADAVALLGFKQLQALILSSHVFEAFTPKGCNPPVSVETLWQQSMLAANLARRIALSLDLADDRPDQAYMGGLLHNLGLLLFASRMTEQLGQVVRDLMADPGAGFAGFEQQYLGTTHTEAAAYVLGLWHLPPRIVEAVMLQDCPADLRYHAPCAVTAVHAAVAILGESAEPPYCYFSFPLDLAYLELLGVGHRVGQWRAFFERLSEKAQGKSGDTS
jgi:HD-like signal output (HDOD) protein/CheY-like chemotaxis protein